MKLDPRAHMTLFPPLVTSGLTHQREVLQPNACTLVLSMKNTSLVSDGRLPELLSTAQN